MPVEEAYGCERQECETQWRNHEQFGYEVAQAEGADQATTGAHEDEPESEYGSPGSTDSGGDHRCEGSPGHEDDARPQPSSAHASPPAVVRRSVRQDWNR